MSKPPPTWAVPVDDGSEPAHIEIREERVSPPCVWLDLKMPTRLLTPLEATQLGMALQEAGREAGQRAARRKR